MKLVLAVVGVFSSHVPVPTYRCKGGALLGLTKVGVLAGGNSRARMLWSNHNTRPWSPGWVRRKGRDWVRAGKDSEKSGRGIEDLSRIRELWEWESQDN